MRLNNVIVISRQLEFQEFAQEIADNVFAADDTSEALDVVKRVCPELILVDRHIDRDAVADFSTRVRTASAAQFVFIGSQDAEKTVNLTDTVHEVSGLDDNRLQKIIDHIRQNPSLDHVEGHPGAFFSDDLALAAEMVGKSTSLQHTLKKIKLVADSQCNPVLIIGEMGTGKELAAKAIHHRRCSNKPFIAVNCASLSANLLESELFGHEKGAFTSADREKTGLLELAGDGCIFLDEISEVPIELQAKLLRVIQEKNFRKVGGTKEIACRATIIASSNRDLKKEVQANRFRGDLYHRLSIFPILLSPLRCAARRQDIRLLAEYFFRTSTICPEKSARMKAITNLAFEALENHDWPGNVRELRNVIERAILLETTDKIGVNSIIIDAEEPDEYFQNDSVEKLKDFSLAKAEQELIARVLQETNGQKTKAAELLGISRATLYAKVKQHNIEVDTLVHPDNEMLSAAFAEPIAAA